MNRELYVLIIPKVITGIVQLSLFCGYLGRFILLCKELFLCIQSINIPKSHIAISLTRGQSFWRDTPDYSCCRGTCVRATRNSCLGSCFLAPLPLKGSSLCTFLCLPAVAFNTLMDVLTNSRAEISASRLTQHEQMPHLFSKSMLWWSCHTTSSGDIVLVSLQTISSMVLAASLWGWPCQGLTSPVHKPNLSQVSQADHITHTLIISEHLHDEKLGKTTLWSCDMSSINWGHPKLSCQYIEVTTRVPSPRIQKECLLTLLKAKGFSCSADREESERKKKQIISCQRPNLCTPQLMSHSN